MTEPEKKRLVLGITGATGAIYALRILQIMYKLHAEWEVHLVISTAGLLNLKHELGLKAADISGYASVVHDVKNVGASIASGAFRTEGMLIVPCSMKTMAAIAHAYSDNLITRAADVTLKERRRLVIVPRETPLNLAHLRNMSSVTEMGGVVFPPMPGFYSGHNSLSAVIDETVGRLLDFFGITQHGLYPSWEGISRSN